MLEAQVPLNYLVGFSADRFAEAVELGVRGRAPGAAAPRSTWARGSTDGGQRRDQRVSLRF